MDLSLKMFKDIPSVVAHHYREGTINWIMVVYMSLNHMGALAGVARMGECNPKTLVWAYALYYISGLGITVGAHRLWAHRSYQAALPARIFLMLCNSLANQFTLHRWCRNHRLHHTYSETDADPHDARRGFFFAHIGWLLVKRREEVRAADKAGNFDDLAADPVVRFQRKFDPFISLYLCYIMPAQVAKYMWGEDFWTGFLIAGVVRYIGVLHITFLVNSAAHLYGDKPYEASSYAAENPFVSFFAMGEGWHNWHHKYPFDYAASEFGISSQFNPSKLFIDMLALFGLVWGRKRGTSQWAMARARRNRAGTEGHDDGKASSVLLRKDSNGHESGGDSTEGSSSSEQERERNISDSRMDDKPTGNVIIKRTRRSSSVKN